MEGIKSNILLKLDLNYVDVTCSQAYRNMAQKLIHGSTSIGMNTSACKISKLGHSLIIAIACVIPYDSTTCLL